MRYLAADCLMSEAGTVMIPVVVICAMRFAFCSVNQRLDVPAGPRAIPTGPLLCVGSLYSVIALAVEILPIAP